jgi:hypothetical protein
MGWSNKVGVFVACWMPWMIKPLVNRLSISLAKDKDPQALENAISKGIRYTPEADRRYYEIEEVRHNLAQSLVW